MASLTVSLSENGPYRVDGDFRLLDSRRRQLETTGAVELCRCGESQNKPFCDSLGCEAGFEAAGESGPPGSRQYTGSTIHVGYDASICIHDAACIYGAPGVFDVKKRPWIDLKDTDAERIARVIRECPSGALQYRRQEGGDAEQPERPATILAVPNGPYYLRGDIQIVSPTGERLYKLPAGVALPLWVVPQQALLRQQPRHDQLPDALGVAAIGSGSFRHRCPPPRYLVTGPHDGASAHAPRCAQSIRLEHIAHPGSDQQAAAYGHYDS